MQSMRHAALATAGLAAFAAMPAVPLTEEEEEVVPREQNHIHYRYTELQSALLRRLAQVNDEIRELRKDRNHDKAAMQKNKAARTALSAAHSQTSQLIAKIQSSHPPEEDFCVSEYRRCKAIWENN